LTLGEEVANGGAVGEERAGGVGVEGGPPTFRGAFMERPVAKPPATQTGDVKEDVEAAEVGKDLSEKVIDLSGVGGVAGEAGDAGQSLAGVKVGEDDTGAFGEEARGRRQANAAGADEQTTFVVQAWTHYGPLPNRRLSRCGPVSGPGPRAGPKVSKGQER
jgi:hypothetical protein